jgi:hypothetical protein
MKGPPNQGELLPWLSEGSDASPELRELFRVGGALPDDSARIERLRSRLGPWLAVAPNPPSPHSPAPASNPAVENAGLNALGAGAKLLLVGAVAAAVAIAASATRPSTQAAPPMHTTPTRPSAAPTPSMLPRAELPVAEPPVAEPPPAPERTPTRAAPKPSAVEPHSASLGEQARELEAARQLVASNPGGALELLRRHSQQYRISVLDEERRLFTIEALSRLGRGAEAQAELDALRRGYPRSAHLSRAERMLGISAP